MKPHYRTVFKGALLTVATLFGGILVGMGLGNLVFVSLPGHSMDDPSFLHVFISAIPLLMGLLAGGAGWGIAMGRIAKKDDRRTMALAGIRGFVPVTVVMTFALLWLEPIVIAEFGNVLPIHRVFTLFFVPTAFLIGGISAWALGDGLGDRQLARSLLWKVGLSAAGAFLVVNLVMEAAGWVVGGPGAAERATMVTVMSLGNLAAALVGGGLLGWLLSKRDPEAVSASERADNG